jgi:hypothetical protein
LWFEKILQNEMFLLCHPRGKQVTLSLYEWKELKKTIPLFEDKEPELRTINNKVTGED